MFLLAFPFDAPADSCRWGNKLVSTGDTKSEVLANCAPPTWAEERIERIHGDSYYNEEEVREPIFGKVKETVDEWVYNFGPNRFIQIFRFENGKLVGIENGNYGYLFLWDPRTSRRVAFLISVACLQSLKNRMPEKNKKNLTPLQSIKD